VSRGFWYGIAAGVAVWVALSAAAENWSLCWFLFSVTTGGYFGAALSRFFRRYETGNDFFIRAVATFLGHFAQELGLLHSPPLRERIARAGFELLEQVDYELAVAGKPPQGKTSLTPEKVLRRLDRWARDDLLFRTMLEHVGEIPEKGLGVLVIHLAWQLVADQPAEVRQRAWVWLQAQAQRMRLPAEQVELLLGSSSLAEA